MPLESKCSECGRAYTLADDLLGKKVRCKGCGEVFTVAQVANEAPRVPKDISVRSGAPSASPAKKPVKEESLPPKRRPVDEDEDDRPRRRRDASRDDEDEDRPRPRARKKAKAGSSGTLVWILVGVGVFLMGIMMVVAVTFALMTGQAQVAKMPAIPPAPPPGIAPIAPAPNQADHGQVPVPPPQGGPPPVAQPPAIVNKVPQPPAPAGLYADFGNEEIAPADPGLPNTALRPRAEDSIYRLSNPRVGRPMGFGPPGNALMVDYEVLRRGKSSAGTLIVHGGDGRRSQVMLLAFGRQDRGTIEVSSFGPFAQFPQNAELYLVRTDSRYGVNMPTFKVSNSVTMGTMPITTKARNWTAEEIARLTAPPPNHTAANVHPKVGKDTEFVGDTQGGVKLRYVEPKGHLLGLDFRMGEWEKEKCFAGLTAVFSREQPPTILTKRVIAKEGYAVSGAEVYHERFAGGMKLHFQKLKADGSLDPKDAYTSDLFGEAASKTKTIGNDGSKILGINVQQGAIVNAIALVKE